MLGFESGSEPALAPGAVGLELRSQPVCSPADVSLRERELEAVGLCAVSHLNPLCTRDYRYLMTSLEIQKMRFEALAR